MKWSDLLSKDSLAVAQNLSERANTERKNNHIICPNQDQIFRALELTSPDKLKVCIIGQDPYHTPGQANGLAFSIANGNPIQPSLYNIFKELVSDTGCQMPTTTDLTPWAEQGVLLLNATLTVEAHMANSHSDWGWDEFTSEVFRACTQLQQPVVFLAWGNFAHNIIYNIYPKNSDWDKILKDNHKACVFTPHPSPLSASRGFFGSKPFSYANDILKSFGSEPINWNLP